MLTFTHEKTSDLGLSQLLKLFTTPQCFTSFHVLQLQIQRYSILSGQWSPKISLWEVVCHFRVSSIVCKNNYQEFHTIVIMSYMCGQKSLYLHRGHINKQGSCSLVVTQDHMSLHSGAAVLC